MPRESRARIRRILSSAKRKCRCACRSCGREFHRDARQDRVEDISREEEIGSYARSRAARNISAALHNGYFYKNALRESGKTGTDPGFTGVCELVPNRSDLGCSDALVIGNLSQARHYKRKFHCGKSARLINFWRSPYERKLANRPS